MGRRGWERAAALATPVAGCFAGRQKHRPEREPRAVLVVVARVRLLSGEFEGGQDAAQFRFAEKKVTY